MTVCNINKSRFINFMGTLSLRENVLAPPDDEVTDTVQSIRIGNMEFSFYIVNFSVEGKGNFVPANGNWAELKENFKTNK